PGLPQVHLWLADAYREAGDGARALQALKAGLQRLPDEPALYRAEALLLSGQGQPDQALEVAQQLKARDKTGWQGLLLEGDLLAQQRRDGDALRA
ncbi:tetratricopeptide repeat protein, partial [Acinetobacter baumannii]